MYTLFILIVGYSSLTSQVIPGFTSPIQCVKEAKALEVALKKRTVTVYCVKVK